MPSSDGCSLKPGVGLQGERIEDEFGVAVVAFVLGVDATQTRTLQISPISTGADGVEKFLSLLTHQAFRPVATGKLDEDGMPIGAVIDDAGHELQVMLANSLLVLSNLFISLLFFLTATDFFLMALGFFSFYFPRGLNANGFQDVHNFLLVCESRTYTRIYDDTFR